MIIRIITVGALGPSVVGLDDRMGVAPGGAVPVLLLLPVTLTMLALGGILALFGGLSGGCQWRGYRP
jgi:hypothetical protein